LPEVTDQSEYVWECEPNNPQSITKQIEACISNPELRKEKSQNGKKYIHERFGIKNVVSHLMEILEN